MTLTRPANPFRHLIALYLLNFISFSGPSQTVSGVSLETAKSRTFISAYKKGAIKSMKANITEDDIVITDIKSTEVRRTLLATAIEISSAVAVANVDPVALKTNLNTAIANGAFTQALVADGYTSATASAVATLVDTTSTSPTAAPTNGPGKKTYPTGSAVGIAIGGFIGLCIICCASFYFCCKAKSETGPVGGDKDERGEEFGRGAYNEDPVRPDDTVDSHNKQSNNL